MVASTKKERGVLFCGEMVRALLAGHKTMTRRVVKPQPQVESDNDASWRDGKADLWRNKRQYIRDCCPFGKVGDRLWVKETWQIYDCLDGEVGYPLRSIPKEKLRNCCISYAADDAANGPWRPSIFMPRWASRITLEITAVRVERLNEISASDCIAEGILESEHICDCEICAHSTLICPATQSSLITAYAALWDSIHGKGAWGLNPFVWVYEFRVLEPKASAS